MPYRGLKRLLWRAYTAFEECNVQWMANHALTFANGEALHAQAFARRPRRDQDADDDHRCGHDRDPRRTPAPPPRIRLLSVSRIDPRKGLRVLPEAVALLAAGGCDASLDIIGPVVGAPGEDGARRDRDALAGEPGGCRSRVAARPGSARSTAASLPRLRLLRAADPAGRGRSARAARSDGRRASIVTSRVSGIPSLITDGSNGLLVEVPSARAVADARHADRPTTPALRRRLIADGYATAARTRCRRRPRG